MVQTALYLCASVAVLCSIVVFCYRERSGIVLFVVYCVAVWYCGTESGLLVCSLWFIVKRC